ncbi:hypothetical protein DSECCO2_339740 [anaerobic digester metagenome]|jgi:hypothetical protein|uniref:hypothetical protein n=1 Tax=Petrimonas sp. TaxID=2023866 RepID=UPI0030CD212B
MRTTHWVYISKDANGELSSRITSEIDNIMFCVLVRGCDVVYLHPFNSPFDALAHKHLIDDLSRRTIKAIIKKKKTETEMLLKTMLFTIH